MRRRQTHKPGLPLGMIDALAALYGGGPMSADERQEFKQRLADQRAKDEQARAPQPDLLRHVEPTRRGTP